MHLRQRRYENGRTRACERFALVLALCLSSLSIYGGEWTVEPRLSVKETLTDNLKLSYTNEQREAVTQVKPGVAIHEKGGRSTLDLDYGLNGLIYANESAYNDVYHELDADAHQRLVGENVSVAERASVRHLHENAPFPDRRRRRHGNPGTRPDSGAGYRTGSGHVESANSRKGKAALAWPAEIAER